MPEPLLFVCTSKPVRRGSKLARVSLATFEAPSGTVFMAFGSRALAAMTLALYGAGEGVFLLSETRLVPELVPAPSTSPVLVFRTADDYNEAMDLAPDFPWAERIIQYDFAAAAANAAVTRDDFGGEDGPLRNDGAPPK